MSNNFPETEGYLQHVPPRQDASIFHPFAKPSVCFDSQAHWRSPGWVALCCNIWDALGKRGLGGCFLSDTWCEPRGVIPAVRPSKVQRMAGKRKRSRPNHRAEGDQKRQKISETSSSKESVVKEALLAQFYPQVISLRAFLILKLPPSSKVRRKKILSVGKTPDSEADQKLSKFLDQTLVGVSKHKGVSQEERWQQWTTFSQKADDSISFANTTGVGIFSQSEVGTIIYILPPICYGMLMSWHRDIG